MTEPLIIHLQQQLLQNIDSQIRIVSWQRIYGGDINATYIIRTNNATYFVKVNDQLSPDAFEKEWHGLTLLRSKSSLKIPEPILYGQLGRQDYLVIEYLEKTATTNQIWKKLGEGLAALHQQTQPEFGLSENNYIGSLPQANKFNKTWAEFYATQRILPLFQTARNASLCTSTDVAKAERLCARFGALFPQEPPALLHGDLWSGNVMACQPEEAAIYDPAVYFGHREMDVAMTLLFGGFSPLFYHHYNEVYPLQTGWQQRMDVCQLYPLLVHLNLFGSTYYGRVKAIVDTYA